MAHMRYEIRIAADGRDMADVRALFEEYHAWLGEVVCSRRLAEEIASLPGPYAAPAGRLLLAVDTGGRAVGVVGVRPHEAGGAEIKRLYVRPEARTAGLGRRLMDEAVAAARSLGYGRALITTLPDSMGSALRMYERMGFTPTTPFVDHSHVSEDVRMVYLELRLDEPDGLVGHIAQPI